MARKYVGGYWESVMKHYEFRSDHLKSTRGYEYYGGFTDKINAYGDRDVVDFFVNLQVTGTPEQCYQKAMEIYGYTGTDSLVAAFSYGGMPYDDAERSMRLFASQVLPELQKFEPSHHPGPDQPLQAPSPRRKQKGPAVGWPFGPFTINTNAKCSGIPTVIPALRRHSPPPAIQTLS